MRYKLGQNSWNIAKLVAIAAFIALPTTVSTQMLPDQPKGKADQELELRATEQKIQSGIETKARLIDEIDAIRSDRARLN